MFQAYVAVLSPIFTVKYRNLKTFTQVSGKRLKILYRSSNMQGKTHKIIKLSSSFEKNIIIADRTYTKMTRGAIRVTEFKRQASHQKRVTRPALALLCARETSTAPQPRPYRPTFWHTRDEHNRRPRCESVARAHNECVSYYNGYVKSTRTHTKYIIRATCTYVCVHKYLSVCMHVCG